MLQSSLYPTLSNCVGERARACREIAVKYLKSRERITVQHERINIRDLNLAEICEANRVSV